jgi:hypothetical protein
MACRTLVFAGALAASAAVTPASDAEALRMGAAAAPTALAQAPDAAAVASTADTSDLGPTTAPPWNPPRPVSGNATWETVVRAPGRLVSLPLSALGQLGRRSLMIVEENSIVPRLVYHLRVLPAYGVTVTTADLGERTGLGGALILDPPPLRRWIHTEWSASTRDYSRARVAAFAGPAWADYAYDWRPTEAFYGAGLGAREEDGSAYAAQGEQVRAGIGWPLRRPGERPARVRASAWAGPRALVMRAGRVVTEGDEDSGDFDVDDRRLSDVFPALAAAIQDVPVEHLVYGGRGVVDLRTGRPHWTEGVRLEGTIERFDRPLEALALHTARPTGRPFTRVTMEAETGFSFWRDPRTFRLAVRAVDQELSSGTGVLLLPDLARLGGGTGLWGFQPHRFQDSDAVVGRVTYLFPLAQHFEFDVHAEAGGVYGDLWDEPRIAGLRTSFGVALRPRTRFAPLGFVGVDVSRESVRVRYGLGGVE